MMVRWVCLKGGREGGGREGGGSAFPLFWILLYFNPREGVYILRGDPNHKLYGKMILSKMIRMSSERIIFP